jgi:Uma2 family endonuclease
VLVRIQCDLSFPEHDTLVEPDVAWIRAGDYHDRRPSAGDVLLIAKVAGESLCKDLGEKALLYALVGIPEYWVVDLKARAIHQHREPSSGGYQAARVVTAGETITFGQAKLDVDRLMRSAG